MRSRYGGIDGYPSDIDHEASKFKWEEKKPEEDILNISESDLGAVEGEKKPESDFDIVEIPKTDAEGINADEKQENDGENLENISVKKRSETIEERADLTKEELNKSSEVVEENVELTDDQIRQYKEEMAGEFKNSEELIRIEGVSKNWSDSEVQDKLESNRMWTESMQLDYFKDVLNNEERLKKESGGLDDERWNRMSKKLENLITDKDWDKVIALAGSMNTLESEKFKKLEKTLLDQKAEEGILNEVDKMRGVNGYRVEANPYRFALEIVSVAESFPDLSKKIEIDEDDLDVLKGHLDKKRKEDKLGKEINEIGTKGSNWKIDQLAKNIKKIDELRRKKIIKITK